MVLPAPLDRHTNVHWYWDDLQIYEMNKIHFFVMFYVGTRCSDKKIDTHIYFLCCYDLLLFLCSIMYVYTI